MLVDLPVDGSRKGIEGSTDIAVFENALRHDGQSAHPLHPAAVDVREGFKQRRKPVAILVRKPEMVVLLPGIDGRHPGIENAFEVPVAL